MQELSTIDTKSLNSKLFIIYYFYDTSKILLNGKEKTSKIFS